MYFNNLQQFKTVITGIFSFKIYAPQFYEYSVQYGRFTVTDSRNATSLKLAFNIRNRILDT